jgi:hypothetical protein
MISRTFQNLPGRRNTAASVLTRAESAGTCYVSGVLSANRTVEINTVGCGSVSRLPVIHYTTAWGLSLQAAALKVLI